MTYLVNSDAKFKRYSYCYNGDYALIQNGNKNPRNNSEDNYLRLESSWN